MRKSIQALIGEAEKSLLTMNIRQEVPREASRIYADDGDLTWRHVPNTEFYYSIDYLPVVDVRTSMVGVHRARILSKRSASDTVSSEVKASAHDEKVQKLADRLLIRSVIRDAYLANNFKQVIAVGVSEPSLSTIGERRAYLREELLRLPEEMRRSMAFEIVLQSSARPAAVSSWVEDLAPFCRAIFLRLRRASDIRVFSAGQFTPLATSRLVAIGIEVPSGVAEAGFYKDVESLADLAEAKSMRAYIANVPKQSIFLSAVAAGVGYVTSETLFPAVTTPEAPRRKTLSDILVGAVS